MAPILQAVVTILAPKLQAVVTINWEALQFQTSSMAGRRLQVSRKDFNFLRRRSGTILSLSQVGMTFSYDCASALESRSDHLGLHSTACEGQMHWWREVKDYMERLVGVSQAMMTDHGSGLGLGLDLGQACPSLPWLGRNKTSPLC